MSHKSDAKKPTLLTKATTHYAGELTPIALSALSAWLMVTGLKGLIGFTVSQETALADLIGILIVIAAARWMKLRSAAK